jgi:transcriptional regulator of met regulon
MPRGLSRLRLSLAPRTQDEAGRREVADHLRHATETELPNAIYLLAVLTDQEVGVERELRAPCRYAIFATT